METLTANTTNVDLIKQAFDDFLSGNVAAVVETCDDDVEWGSYENPDVPFGTTYHGKKGVAEFFKTLGENVNYSRFEPMQFFSEGDDVVVLGEHAGTVKSTGKTFDHGWCFHFRMDHGKLKRFFSYVDTREHSRAFN